jgi:hypothetical protein
MHESPRLVPEDFLVERPAEDGAQARLQSRHGRRS